MKKFPQNYPDDAVSILKAMSFTKGRDIKIVGSMALRSQQYAGDYDINETVHGTLPKLVREFQSIIKRLLKKPNVYIGDCKSGCKEEWRVIPKDEKEYSPKRSREHLKKLKQSGIITSAEYKNANKHLSNYLIAKQEIKFHTIRWSVPEILQGHKTLRDGEYFTLQDAFSSPIITKLDVIGFVQNNRYTDFSIIYTFYNGKRVLNPDFIDVRKSLEEAIIYYTENGNPFKALKRKFALARLDDDKSTINKLTEIFNSDLGRVYALSSDIGTLLSLVDYPHLDIQKIRFELDQFKGRMANIYSLTSFLHEEPSILIRLGKAIHSKSFPLMKSKLREIDKILRKTLEDNL